MLCSWASAAWPFVLTADGFASWSSVGGLVLARPGTAALCTCPGCMAFQHSHQPWGSTTAGRSPAQVAEELANDPQWAISLIGPNDGDIEVDASDLTLAEAEAREYGEDDEEDGDDEEADNSAARRAFDKTLGK